MLVVIIMIGSKFLSIATLLKLTFQYPLFSNKNTKLNKYKTAFQYVEILLGNVPLSSTMAGQDTS